MAIQLDLILDPIEHNGTHDKRQFNSFKIKYTSGQRAYITIIKNGMKLTTIAKLMKFESGNVSIKIGKQDINIGTYTII